MSLLSICCLSVLLGLSGSACFGLGGWQQPCSARSWFFLRLCNCSARPVWVGFCPLPVWLLTAGIVLSLPGGFARTSADFSCQPLSQSSARSGWQFPCGIIDVNGWPLCVLTGQFTDLTTALGLVRDCLMVVVKTAPGCCSVVRLGVISSAWSGLVVWQQSCSGRSLLLQGLCGGSARSSRGVSWLSLTHCSAWSVGSVPCEIGGVSDWLYDVNIGRITDLTTALGVVRDCLMVVVKAAPGCCSVVRLGILCSDWSCLGVLQLLCSAWSLVQQVLGGGSACSSSGVSWLSLSHCSAWSEGSVPCEIWGVND